MSNEELAVRIQAGERNLMPALWEQVERFIWMQAGRLYGRQRGRCDACGVAVDDLHQTGFLALVDAAVAFDPARGYKLITYLNFPLQNRWRALLGLRTERQRGDPLNSAGSLDEPISDEGNSTRGELIPDPTAEEAFTDVIEREWLRQLRQAEEQSLTEIDDPDVIRGRYFEGLTFDQLAQRRGATRERVRQQEQKALRQLRHPRIAKRLRPFDDVQSLSLRGTGFHAFLCGGSSTERAVETMEDLRRRHAAEDREIANRLATVQEADRRYQAAIQASRAGEPIDLEEAFQEWKKALLW